MLAAALLCGLGPVVQARAANLIEGLNDASRGTSSVRSVRARSTLVVLQITLAVVLEDARPTEIADRLRRYEALRIDLNRQVRDGSRNAGMLYRSTGLVPDLQAEKIVGIFGGLDLTTYDAERVARDAVLVH